MRSASQSYCIMAVTPFKPKYMSSRTKIIYRLLNDQLPHCPHSSILGITTRFFYRSIFFKPMCYVLLYCNNKQHGRYIFRFYNSFTRHVTETLQRLQANPFMYTLLRITHNIQVQYRHMTLNITMTVRHI